MQNVTVLCVGKLKESYWKEACAEYIKRLGRFCSFNIVEVEEERLPDNPSSAQIENTIKKEGERLSAKIPNGSKIFAMCIEGKLYSSEELSSALDKSAVDGFGNIVFVIGGSWGLSDEIKKCASVRLSMSRMTLPHQLARVVLCEQIYRSYQISSGGKYHK